MVGQPNGRDSTEPEGAWDKQMGLLHLTFLWAPPAFPVGQYVEEKSRRPGRWESEDLAISCFAGWGDLDPRTYLTWTSISLSGIAAHVGSGYCIGCESVVSVCVDMVYNGSMPCEWEDSLTFLYQASGAWIHMFKFQLRFSFALETWVSLPLLTSIFLISWMGGNNCNYLIKLLWILTE